VVKNLHDLDQEVVVVTLDPEPDLLKHVHEMNTPVIQDDGTREVIMEAAGVRRARSIILCTQNDSLNLRMALKARSMNPNIEVVIRIFDDEFAASLESQFGFHAMSATGMAAPVFAATAARIDMTPPLSIEGQAHILANVPVGPRSRLRGVDIHTVEEKFRISVVMLCRDGQRQFHPAGQEVLQPGQTIAILGEPERITQLLHENRI
jgi:Trk K+ transport system NAD-binding subunit